MRGPDALSPGERKIRAGGAEGNLRPDFNELELEPLGSGSCPRTRGWVGWSAYVLEP